MGVFKVGRDPLKPALENIIAEEQEAFHNSSPVGVPIHNTCSPFPGVIDQFDGSLQGLPGLVHNTVSNLENKNWNIKLLMLSDWQYEYCPSSPEMPVSSYLCIITVPDNLKTGLNVKLFVFTAGALQDPTSLPAVEKLTSTFGMRPE